MRTLPVARCSWFWWHLVSDGLLHLMVKGVGQRIKSLMGSGSIQTLASLVNAFQFFCSLCREVRTMLGGKMWQDGNRLIIL